MSYVLGLFTGLLVAVIFAILRNIVFEVELRKTMERFIDEAKKEEKIEVLE